MRFAQLNRSLALATAIVPLVASIVAPAAAATVYWDPTNGTAAGTGSSTPSGTFDTTSLAWNPLADGTGTPQAFVSGATAGSGDTAVFSAGTDATGVYAITQAGTINVSGITVEEGEVTIGTAGVLALGTTGNVAVNAGATLVTNASARISVATGATSLYTLNGGTLRTTATGSAGSFIDIDAGIVLGALGGTIDYQVPSVLNIINVPATLTATSGVISGSGSLTKTGVGVIAVVAPATYTGATFVNGGELRVRTNNNVLPVATALTVGANGIFNTNGLSQAVASLTGSGLVGTGSGTFTINGATSTSFAGSIRDTANAGASGTTGVGGKFVKNGTSTVTLTGNSTYTGATTVTNGGLLLANTTDLALSGTASIAINGAGSSVTLGASNQIKDAANMTLTGGTFATAGFSEGTAGSAGLGTLSLGAGAGVIDLGTGIGDVVAFAASNAATWTGSLKIYNWTGTLDLGSGVDQLYVGTTTGGLTPAQLAKITFYADAGSTPLGLGAVQLASGEVVASASAGLVPEPTTLAAIAGVATLGLVRRRRA